MAKQKAPERQLAPAHKVTMQRVHVCVRALARVYATVCKVCTRVPNCGCMYACQPTCLLTNQTHATCVCIVAATLLLPATHLDS